MPLALLNLAAPIVTFLYVCMCEIDATYIRIEKKECRQYIDQMIGKEREEKKEKKKKKKDKLTKKEAKY